MNWEINNRATENKGPNIFVNLKHQCHDTICGKSTSETIQAKNPF